VTAPDSRPANPPGTDPTLGSLGNAPAAPPPGAPSGPATPAPAPASRQPARHTGRAIGRTLALTLLLFVTVILVLFVVYNNQTVEISLVFTDVVAPLVVALLIAAGLGGLMVALAGVVMRARRRNR
jgi:uncharacterized integral membrane protein